MFGCISCVFYIKPQHDDQFVKSIHVVYLAFSTSNHNNGFAIIHRDKLYILRFLHQTTTMVLVLMFIVLLYILRFLHQTTTCICSLHYYMCCISCVFYIKPQLLVLCSFFFHSCISCVFYIKPQPSRFVGY